MDELLQIAGGKNLRSARMAIDSLKDLFVQTLIPPHRLRYFYEHSFGPAVSDEQLKKWYFEDAIKAKYIAFMRILEVSAPHCTNLLPCKSNLVSIHRALVLFLLSAFREQPEVV